MTGRSEEAADLYRKLLELEPENVISRYKWQDGLGYYESTKDASTDFF